MTTLNIFGTDYNINKEIELIFNSDYGMNVKLTYLNNNVQNIFNITEFHHLFDANRCAFESDIHSTGMTHNINDLKSIEINLATKLHKGYHFE